MRDLREPDQKIMCLFNNKNDFSNVAFWLVFTVVNINLPELRVKLDALLETGGATLKNRALIH